MSENERVVRSSCRMCHGVCQVLVHLDGDRVVKVTGDPDSPTSRGYLCPKGAASPELLYHPDRLTHPLRRVGMRGEGKWERISWDEALTEMATRFSDIKKESGSEYLALCQGTGRPYIDFTQRFASAFGTPNFVAPGHICYFPRVLASILTMGQLPVVDAYGFGGQTPSCVMVWGCNVTQAGGADGMCGGTIERVLQKAQKVIVVDPRRTDPASRADHWLQLRPGTDGALALGMIHTLISEDLLDHQFIAMYTEGFTKLVTHVQPYSAEWAAGITGLSADAIREAARTYATHAPAAILWGNGSGDMGLCSIQTAHSLLILRALTGNIDRPGGDVLWVPPEGIRVKSVFMNQRQGGGRVPPVRQAIGKFRAVCSRPLHPFTYLLGGRCYREAIPATGSLDRRRQSASHLFVLTDH